MFYLYFYECSSILNKVYKKKIKFSIKKAFLSITCHLYLKTVGINELQ